MKSLTGFVVCVKQTTSIYSKTCALHTLQFALICRAGLQSVVSVFRHLRFRSVTDSFVPVCLVIVTFFLPSLLGLLTIRSESLLVHAVLFSVYCSCSDLPWAWCWSIYSVWSICPSVCPLTYSLFPVCPFILLAVYTLPHLAWYM
jgi:hypothetical protein